MFRESKLAADKNCRARLNEDIKVAMGNNVERSWRVIGSQISVAENEANRKPDRMVRLVSSERGGHYTFANDFERWS